MSPTPYARLCCIPPDIPDTYPQAQDLILSGASVDVGIVDVHAVVRMAQTFVNPYKSAVEAVYTFAMQAGAAVCGFELVRGDGTKVKGQAMEKQMAKETYDEAVTAGKTASLGAEQTKDIFSIQVGNILADETITINITFLSPLVDDEKPDQVRFTFPRSYGARYGSPPPEADLISSNRLNAAVQGFSLLCTIQQAVPIKAISCPSSHSIELSLGRPDRLAQLDAAIPDSHLAEVRLVANQGHLLTKDVVLVISATGLDSPRCFIEELQPGREPRTTAMAMTFVPRFNLPDIAEGMEYIFLIDRSGSMGSWDGNSKGRIGLVREALIVLLKGLPRKGTKFNLFSFGSDCNSLWPASKDYTQETMEAAIRHVDSMEADYGGTEINAALESVFRSLDSAPRTKPASVFLLTDGDAWDVSTCVSTVRTALARPGPFIRVLTVGIGTGISTETCDSIARAGEGVSAYIQDDEPVTGKCARLVRASRSPPVREIEVLWPSLQHKEDIATADEDFEIVDAADSKAESATTAPRPINLFSSSVVSAESSDEVGPPPLPSVELGPPSKIQYAPLRPSGIFPGTRTSFYAILQPEVLERQKAPASVTVRGKVATTGEIAEVVVPVSPCSLLPASDPDAPAVIHCLAARALISDLEDGVHNFSPVLRKQFEGDPQLRQAHLKAHAVRLGTTFGLTSKYTSYVAVDQSKLDQRPGVPTRVSLPRGTGTGVLRNDLVGGDPRPLFGKGGGTRVLRNTAFFGSAVASPAGQASLFGSAPGSVDADLSLESMPQPAPAIQQQQACLFQAAPRAAFGFGAPAQGPMESQSSTGAFFGSAVAPPAGQVPTFGSASGLMAADLSLESVPQPAPAVQQQQASLFQAAPRATFGFGAPAQRPKESQTSTEPDSSPPADSADDDGSKLAALARLQRFDGSFPMQPGLLMVVGRPTGFKVPGLSDDVSATVLAVLWMEEHASEESLDLVGKAVEWLTDELQGVMAVDEAKSKVAAAAAP